MILPPETPDFRNHYSNPNGACKAQSPLTAVIFLHFARKLLIDNPFEQVYNNTNLRNGATMMNLKRNFAAEYFYFNFAGYYFSKVSLRSVMKGW